MIVRLLQLFRRSDDIASVLLGLVLFFTPFAVSLSPGVPLEAGKWALTTLLALAAFFFWLVARYREGEVVLPRTTFFLSGVAVVGVTFLSAVLSSAPKISLWGTLQETTTFSTIALFALLAFLFSYYFKSVQRISLALFSFYASFLVVALIFFLHLGFEYVPGLGFLVEPTANVVGKWNDLGIFFGLGVFLSFFTLELYEPKGAMRLLIFSVFFSGLIAACVVNVYLVWVFLAIASLLFIVQRARVPKRGSRISRLGIPVLLVSLVFLLWGTPTGIVGQIFRAIGVPAAESPRPSLGPTFEVGKSALVKDPLLGTGPNRFTPAWFKYRPQEANKSLYWNVPFGFGVGYVPTVLISQGVLGFLAWVIFLVLFALLGFTALFRIKKESPLLELMLITWTAAAYLWAVAIFSIPNSALLVLVFIFTGIFMGSYDSLRAMPQSTISFSGSAQSARLARAVVFLLVASLALLGYYQTRAYMAHKKFGWGVVAGGAGDTVLARAYLRSAISWYPTDLYYRALSEAGLARIKAIANTQGGNLDALRAEFTLVSKEAVGAALSATRYDADNYLNWIALGNIYAAFVPLHIPDAHASAEEAYGKALALFPGSPAVFLQTAQLEATYGDTEKARGYVAAALKEKPDFAPALTLLSDLAYREGSMDVSVKAAEQASRLSPEDPQLHFQLGYLLYREKSYEKAIAELVKAIKVEPDYVSARFLLGLCFKETGDKERARALFSSLLQENPNDAKLKELYDSVK